MSQAAFDPVILQALRQLWGQVREARPAASRRQQLEQDMLLFGLGVGREQFQSEALQLADFDTVCAWIAHLNGGPGHGCLHDLSQRRLSCALQQKDYPPELAAECETLAQMAPVFSNAELDFWQEHGYIVLPQALDAAACAAAAAAVYRHVQAKPEQADSWYDLRKRQGIMATLFQDPALQAARTAPRIQKAFAQLWECHDLYCSIDHCSFHPPEREGYPFQGPYLHWDLALSPDNPVPFDTQALIYLTDTPAEQGAFTCVPGFQHRLADWLKRLPQGIIPDEELRSEESGMPIPGQAGDLLIWQAALPHGSRPNTGESPRIVQYLNMAPPPYKRREYQ
ncbi:phytanoyl-CoA dioxygenase family protein [Massilia sp. W12]|uniref:phytanoyl-CoA dioxygenase family protein n=1 Tax=Massilia sp. W12 TaxID=3126507 RepID=UPI0030CB1EC8